jgi:hypothetical protein
MRKLYTFEVTYTKGGKEYTKNYLKFCQYPKKTKLYKEINYLLDNKVINEYKIF